MQPGDASNLLQTLNDEAAAITHFIGLLQQEQTTLTQGLTDELPALVTQKDQLAEQLTTLTLQRNTLLARDGLPSDRPGIEAWCKKNPERNDIADAWASVMTCAAEAKELNRVNGELISLRMQHNARALEALRSGEQPLSLYGPDGQSQAPNGRRINDSV